MTTKKDLQDALDALDELINTNCQEDTKFLRTKIIDYSDYINEGCEHLENMCIVINKMRKELIKYRAVLDDAISKMETVEQLTKPEENVSRGEVSNADETTTEQSSGVGAKNAHTENGLLPCPFCGGSNLKVGGDDKIVGVWCEDCGSCGPNEYITYPRAVSWDTRAEPQGVEPIEGLEDELEIYNMPNDKIFEETAILKAARAYLSLTKREG